MDESTMLLILKKDLQIMTDKMDDYLRILLTAAASMIRREGITLENNEEDGLLTEMYAAYLYRKRAADNVPMPRMLRYALNNRLFSEKMKGDGGNG